MENNFKFVPERAHLSVERRAESRYGRSSESGRDGGGDANHSSSGARRRGTIEVPGVSDRGASSCLSVSALSFIVEFDSGACYF